MERDYRSGNPNAGLMRRIPPDDDRRGSGPFEDPFAAANGECCGCEMENRAEVQATKCLIHNYRGDDSRIRRTLTHNLDNLSSIRKELLAPVGNPPEHKSILCVASFELRMPCVIVRV